MAADPRLEHNRSWWDERVPIHVGSAFYDVDGFRAGGSTLRPFELEEVGDVAGKRLATCSATSGSTRCPGRAPAPRWPASTSPGPRSRPRRRWRAETGLDARFVQADVYDAVEALGGERFDVVYTGLGALNWLPDLPRWASVVASLLADGGFLYLAEFHPITWVFADDDPIDRVRLLPRSGGGLVRRRRAGQLRRPRGPDAQQRDPRVGAPAGRRRHRGARRRAAAGAALRARLHALPALRRPRARSRASSAPASSTASRTGGRACR